MRTKDRGSYAELSHFIIYGELLSMPPTETKNIPKPIPPGKYQMSPDELAKHLEREYPRLRKQLHKSRSK